MSNPPEVSIIVPAHNVARFIGETLESIRAQSFVDWECIVVDDGSSDHTASVVMGMLKLDNRFRLIRQSCGGASMARNRGFMESLPLARYVTFMDADDVWEPGALRALYDRLEAHPKAVGAHGLAETIDGDGRPLAKGNFCAFGRRRLGYRDGKIVEWPVCEPTEFETLVWTGPLYPPGLLLARREVYERAGLYDSRLSQCEDWDMCLRLSRYGPIEFLDQVLLSYRRHDRNLSNDVRGNRHAVRRLHRKTFFSAENSPLQKEMLKRGWRAWQQFKMREKWREAKRDALKGAPLRVLKTFVGFPVHLLRYARGYPSKLGF